MNSASFWNKTVPRLLSSYAVLTFVVLWIGLAVALMINPVWVERLWKWIQELPSLVRILAWIFLTPLMTALWIWESNWTSIVRVLAFAGIAGWTALAVSSFRKAFR